MKILVINGPNLNFLGIREPELYGKRTYEDLVETVRDYCEGKNIEVEFFQSNHEGAIVDEIQRAYYDKIDGIVINPAAYTHTSVAISDALKAVSVPAVEVHISDVNRRETFRRISYVRDVCLATVSGEGFSGYLRAVDMLEDAVERNGGNRV